MQRSTGSRLGMGLCVLVTLTGIAFSARGVPAFFSGALAIGLLVLVAVLALYPWEHRRECRVESGVAAACAGLLLGIAFTNWPVRLSHALSRDAFERIAQRAREGARFHTPFRVGLFTIHRVEVRARDARSARRTALVDPAATDRNDIVCLWTDPRTETFIAQCAADRPQFNVWSMATLDRRWLLVTED